MSSVQQFIEVPVALTLTGHPIRGCAGGLTHPVFRLADLIG